MVVSASTLFPTTFLTDPAVLSFRSILPFIVWETCRSEFAPVSQECPPGNNPREGPKNPPQGVTTP